MTPAREQLAVVTGAASGIGAATRAPAGSIDGATVVVCDVAEDAGEAIAAEVGGDYVHLDVGDPAGWEDLLAQRRATDGSTRRC